MNKRVILGVDPGFGVTGYAILKRDDNGNVFLVDFGYLKLNSKDHLSVRVGLFYDHFLEKIKKYSVTNIALETSFLGRNPQVFLKLGYLRGILYLLANKNCCELYEFAPREVKISVTGFGGATKDQVAMMVLRLFPKLEGVGKIAKNDVTDALAVSLCGLWSSQKSF